jgi:hypothetical protein
MHCYVNYCLVKISEAVVTASRVHAVAVGAVHKTEIQNVEIYNYLQLRLFSVFGISRF